MDYRKYPNEFIYLFLQINTSRTLQGIHVSEIYAVSISYMLIADPLRLPFGICPDELQNISHYVTLTMSLKAEECVIGSCTSLLTWIPFCPLLVYIIIVCHPILTGKL